MNAAALLWENRFKVAMLALAAAVAMLGRQQEKIGALGQALLDKPKVETHVETRTVQGPVRIVEKIVTTPGGERIVERIITRDAVTRDTNAQRVERPNCPAQYVPKWIVGASANPLKAQEGQMIRVGYSVNGRIDVTYGHSINTRDTRHEIGTAFRF